MKFPPKFAHTYEYKKNLYKIIVLQFRAEDHIPCMIQVILK